MKTQRNPQLLKIVQILEELRKLDSEMQAQQALVFITVALNEGMTMKDLGKNLGISQSSCSRNIAALSRIHRLNKLGLDLVVATEDPEERRRKVLRLTHKGKKVIETLEMLAK